MLEVVCEDVSGVWLVIDGAESPPNSGFAIRAGGLTTGPGTEELEEEAEVEPDDSNASAGVVLTGTVTDSFVESGRDGDLSVRPDSEGISWVDLETESRICRMGISTDWPAAEVAAVKLVAPGSDGKENVGVPIGSVV